MELEARVAELEKQVRELKTEIRQTLMEIEKTLPAEQPQPRNWNRTAWVLALVNLLLAVVLFGNAFLLTPWEESLGLSPVIWEWLRALWMVMAFVWMLLQLYPLALLLTEDEKSWQRISWRNAMQILRVRPGLLLFLTLLVLASALINVFIPAAWFLITLVLLVVVAGLALRAILEPKTA